MCKYFLLSVEMNAIGLRKNEALKAQKFNEAHDIQQEELALAQQLQDAHDSLIPDAKAYMELEAEEA